MSATSPYVYTVLGDKTITAKFQGATYNITYLDKGGTTFSGVHEEGYPTTHTYGSETSLKTASKTNYTFAGWYKTSDCSGDAVSKIEATEYNEDFSLYAKWTPTDYTITYHNADGATNPNPTTYNVESEIITLQNASKPNYDFVGWYLDDAFQTQITNIPKGSSGNKDIYAKWSATNFTITYHNVEGATHSNPATYNIETPTFYLNQASKNGYSFVGWYTDEEFKNPITTITIGSTGNKDIYAKWSPITYTITYHNVTGATNNNPKTYTIETPTFDLYDASRPNYYFAGWYTDSAFNNPIVAIATGSSGNKDLYAKWTAMEYSIFYELNGGIAPSPENPSKYTVDTETFSLNSPTKVGYTFDGWYDNDSFQGSKITQIVKGSSGNKTLFAKWTAKEYTISYFDSDGSNFSGIHDDGYPTSHKYGTITTLKGAKKDGYVFKGWYKEVGCPGNAITTINPSEYTNNIILYAKWADAFTITFNMNGHGSQVAALQVEKNTTAKEPIKPVEKGYTFVGWYKESTCITPWNFSTDVVNENISLHAKWTINKYTVTFNMNGHGNPISSMQIEYGQYVTSPVNPTADGFTFIGWYKDAAFNNVWNFSTDKIEDNITLYAKWDANAKKMSTATLIAIIGGAVGGVAVITTAIILIIKKRK